MNPTIARQIAASRHQDLLAAAEGHRLAYEGAGEPGSRAGGRARALGRVPGLRLVLPRRPRPAVVSRGLAEAGPAA